MNRYLQHVWLFFFISISAVNTSSAQAPLIHYKISGHTSQKAGKVRLLLYINRSQFVPYDSADIKNGRFTFSGALDEPKSFRLQIGDKGRILFVGNENIVVNERNQNTGGITVTGSKLSEDYDDYFNHRIASLLIRAQAINGTLDSLDATHRKEIDSLTKLQESSYDQIPDSAAAFIIQKPLSFVSLYLLNYNIDSYKTETIANLYSRLDTSLKSYPSAQFIKRRTELGAHLPLKSPSFSVTDERGQKITLKSFKGNYLLIDFWATWCIPCIKDMIVIQKATRRFQDKNFKVLTASLDIDSIEWEARINAYQLKQICRNVFLSNQFGNPMAIQFQVSTIPRLILIDPEGNIIEESLRSEQLNDRLEKIFTVSVDNGEDAAFSQSRSSLRP